MQSVYYNKLSGAIFANTVETPAVETKTIVYCREENLPLASEVRFFQNMKHI